MTKPINNNNSISAQDDLDSDNRSSTGNKKVKGVKRSSQQSNASVLLGPKNKATEGALPSGKVDSQIPKKNKVPRRSANNGKGAQKAEEKFKISSQVRTKSKFN